MCGEDSSNIRSPFRVTYQHGQLKTVGVHGGGQIGRMLTEAANRLNIRVVTLDSYNLSYDADQRTQLPCQLLIQRPEGDSWTGRQMRYAGHIKAAALGKYLQGHRQESRRPAGVGDTPQIQDKYDQIIYLARRAMHVSAEFDALPSRECFDRIVEIRSTKSSNSGSSS